MEPKDMDIHEINEKLFESIPIIKHAYVTDPPKFLLRYLDKETILEIARIKYQTLAKNIRLESEIQANAASMLEQTHDILAKFKP